MAKISAYSEQTDPTDDDYHVIVRSGANYKIKLSTMLEYVPTTPGDWGSPEPTSIKEALDALAASSGSGVIADGDYGDIIVSSSGTVWELESDALTSLTGLTPTADGLPYYTGASSAALTTLTTFARLLLDDTDAATMRATLDLEPGTDVQAYDADLAAIAALTPSNDDVLQRKAGAWTNRTIAQLVVDLLAGGIRAPSIQAVISSATVTPTFSDDMVKITAQAAALALANPTGTAIPGLGMVIRIKDNGTARAISYDTQYRAIGITLPTTTVISKTTYIAMIYNADDTKWDCVATGTEA